MMIDYTGCDWTAVDTLDNVRRIAGIPLQDPGWYSDGQKTYLLIYLNNRDSYRLVRWSSRDIRDELKVLLELPVHNI